MTDLTFGSHVGPVARARRNDLETSHEAAESITPSIREMQRRVLEYARERVTFTDVALNAHFGTTSSTLRTRRSELVAMGLIEDTGERLALGSGRRHAVWRITAKGVTA